VSVPSDIEIAQQARLRPITDVAAEKEEGLDLASAPAREAIEECDCVVILTDPGDFDYAHVAGAARSIVDARNAMRGVPGDHITRL
jgi:UDP-N-acetyl-D-mannosaminuronate dehydrogenase